jgi:putative peptidoglycan lipid II flippase
MIRGRRISKGRTYNLGALNESRRIVRSAWGITAWTVVSRFAGVLRDMTIARFLGASALSDVFYAAYRIPNLFRAVVGEGGLPGTLVPIAKKIERERPGEEGTYAGRVLSLLLVILVGLVLVGIAIAPFLVRLVAPGFQATPGKFELAVRLTRWMFPYILLVSAAALLESYLNAKGRFQLSAATPVALNLSIVAAAWLLAPAGVSAPIALACGVLFGGFLQFAIQVPAVRRLGFRFGASPWGDPEVSQTALRIAPRLWGMGIGQVNMVISSRILSAMGDAFYTYNFAAFRIADVVLGGFVVSVTRALLPAMSEQALEKDRAGYLRSLSLGLRLTTFVTLPSMVGLALAARPIVDVIFRGGKFDAAAVDQTAAAVVFFSIGLFAAAATKILTQAFYALHDTRTPVIVATFDLLAFWGLCLVLAGPMKHTGVALATSAGFWINFGLLFVLLRRKLGRLGGRELLASALRLGAASLLMGLWVLLLTRRLVPYDVGLGFLLRASWVGAVCVSAALVFLVAAKVLGAPEVEEALGGLRRRRTTA